jgi:hypothetical protein
MKFRVMVTDDPHASFDVDQNVDVVSTAGLAQVMANLMFHMENASPHDDPMVLTVRRVP